MSTVAVHTPTNLKLTRQYVLEWRPTCLISGIVNLGETLAMGQKLLIPVLCASTVPAFPSGELPPIGVLSKPLGSKWLNKNLSWGKKPLFNSPQS